MPIEELKCIELLMRFLRNNNDLEYTDFSTFKRSKFNLFNYININNLLKNFSFDQSFSLEEFLYTGQIPGIYSEKTKTPKLEPNTDYKKFYKYLLEALRENNFLFDENNDIYISSLKLETIIPQIWLYRLSEATKRNKYERMYFFNKNRENNIIDKNSLISYLYHTKTFLVELSSSNPNIDYALEFSTAEAKTNLHFRNTREVRVEDLMSEFENNVSPEVMTKIRKYKVSDAFWIVSKAEALGRDFYNEPLEVQQKYINAWMLEFINSNEKSNKETQKFILLFDSVSKIEETNYNKKEIIIGLFNLYIKLLSELHSELELVSLSDFRIIDYKSVMFQDNYSELTSLIKKINKILIRKSELKEEIDKSTENIRGLEQVKEGILFKKEKERYESLLEAYKYQEEQEENLTLKRNRLQELIRQEQEHSIESIAFDNEKILSLINEAVNYGRVYFKQGSNQLVIELYNDMLGKTIFKASITLENLISFIENTNYSLKDFSISY